MKKLISVLLIITLALALFSCSPASDAPEGMQLVDGGEDLGYYFYGPEEWIVANLDTISVTYASSVDTTSATYTETDMPSVTVEEYFEDSLSEFVIQPTVILNGEAATFGNADSAKKYVYDVTYSEHTFRVMQIFVKYGERFGIFTFTALNEKTTSDEKTQYDYYAEKVQSIIDNFKFVKKSASTPSKEEYEKDEDGYLLVSDKHLCGFSLYAPEIFKVTYSSGIVNAAASDGSNVSMVKTSVSGITFSDYWKLRKAELEAVFGSVTVIYEDNACEFGNSLQAFAYEYTYTFGGEVYKVYQVLARTNFDGYVFTYTAKEALFDTHIDTVKKITEKVKF
jgi:hypothetical protein